MPCRIDEACRSYAPGAIHRAIQQGHPTSGKPGTLGIHIITMEGEDETGFGVAIGHLRRIDEVCRFCDFQQVDKGVAELE